MTFDYPRVPSVAVAFNANLALTGRQVYDQRPMGA